SSVIPVMKCELLGIVALCAGLPLGAQNQTADSDALRWSLALGGRLRDLREPVVAANAIGNLAVLMCPYDRTSAASLFHDSLNRLRLLTPESFRSPNQLLPASSFTALWGALVPAAEKC